VISNISYGTSTSGKETDLPSFLLYMFSPVLAITFFLPDYLLADGQCDGK
jgi:hypothetical protein